MNLICNNCCGARIYRLSNQQYNNPFTWSFIEPMEFVKLIKEYDTIDFYNIKISLETRQTGRTSILCELDNGVKLHYIHHNYKDCDFVIDGNNIFYRNIIEYFSHQYFSRLDRMTKLNETPTFLMSFNHFNKTEKNYKECVNELIRLNNDKIYVFVHNDMLTNFSVSKTNVIGFSDDVIEPTGDTFSNSIKHYFFK